MTAVRILPRILMMVLALMVITTASAQDKLPARPDPPRLVNDMAGMLSGDETQALEQKLTAYSDSTSTQIAVLTINSLEGGDAAQYATEIIHEWGIGIKGRDNGVLILISKDEHKIFIATGRGVEENLPDIIAKQIVDRIISPQFKAGNYYAGINSATDEIMSRLSGQFTNDQPAARANTISTKWIALIIVIIILLFIFFIGGRRGETHSGLGSSGFWFLLGMLGGSGGGGGSGGDDDGGGGGGFSGFGGGDSGGGGAGGSW